MSEVRSEISPLRKAWNIFSAISSVIGTAGMVDDIVNWVGLFHSVIQGYQQIIHPLFAPITNFVHMPNWFSDYLFIGCMVVSARIRPTFNNMSNHWDFDISSYRWYSFWAPHRTSMFIMSGFLIFFWPFMLILFLPPKVVFKTMSDETYEFQFRIWKEQIQWLAIYVIAIVGLFIANTGLNALFQAVSK